MMTVFCRNVCSYTDFFMGTFKVLSVEVGSLSLTWERNVLHYFFSHGATAPSGSRPPHYRGSTITLRHTTLGKTPPDQ